MARRAMQVVAKVICMTPDLRFRCSLHVMHRRAVVWCTRRRELKVHLIYEYLIIYSKTALTKVENHCIKMNFSKDQGTLAQT